jgi:hypothetical protein
MKQTITCEYCGSAFDREAREIKRSQKKGRKNFCSRSCCGKTNINNIPLDKRGSFDISLHSSNRKDEFSGFREFLRRARNRNLEINLDLKDLVLVWNSQNGICPYSGVVLKLPSSKNNSKIYTASLDRIDSSKGYVKDNIQFVSTTINFMKNTLSDEETKEFCKQISKFWQ